jgi:hypothetical protein
MLADLKTTMRGGLVDATRFSCLVSLEFMMYPMCIAVSRDACI